MWAVLGPFDSEVPTNEARQLKLLKAGEYVLGRRNCPLLINSKKISSQQCTLKVGKLAKDGVVDPSARPTIEINVTGKNSIGIKRDDEEFGVQGKEFIELQEGDVITLPGHHQLEIKWESICCYMSSSRTSTVPLDACAELGIHVVHSFSKEVTIHLSSSYTASPAMAASLMCLCQIAKPEWLNKVIRAFPEEENAVLDKLPSMDNFKPSLAPSLPPEHKVHEVWQPKPERTKLFKKYRFICLVENNNLDKNLREILKRGEGSVDVADIHAGKTKFRSMLTRAAAKSTESVFVADPEAMEAASAEKWKEIVEVAKEFNLHVVTPSNIVDAVLSVDTSIFSTKSTNMDVDEQPQRAASPLPSFVPNSIPEEPSVPPQDRPEETPQPTPSETSQAAPTRRKLPPRRNRPPSEPPAESSQPQPQREGTQEPEAPKPRRLPPRLNAGRINPSEDNSVVLNAIETVNAAKAKDRAPSVPPEPQLDLTTPAPVIRKLKRRFKSGDASSSAATPVEPAEEPPVKKFKALYEESAGATLSETMQLMESVMQSGPSNPGGVPGSLEPVAEIEEAEGSQAQTQTMSSEVSARGTKRKASSTEDQEMADVEELAQTQTRSTSRAGSVRPASKRTAIENVNAVERTQTAAAAPSSTAAPAPARASSKPPPSTSKTSGKGAGAAPGKPDTDEAFLKAVASTKRGKKNEDNFDREFNKLKISKPELGHEANEEEQWTVLEDFGDDSNIRGNFMVVVELDVFKERHLSRVRRQESHPEWQGLPNYKKFKRKDARQRTRAPVELVVDNDFGMGDDGWKDDEKIKDSSSQSLPPTQASRPLRSQALVVADSDSEDSEPAGTLKSRRAASKAGSRAGSAKPTRAPAKKSAKSAKSMSLFLEDDEDESQLKNDSDSDDGPSQTLKSTAASSKPATRKGASRKAAIVVEDDSDDDFTFKGFKGKSRR
ncbi:hypothetical protein VKT23_003777 [Stygiomarasmius scandens]|uniref:Nibrin second BRCT domain-containing protein n=1 Tax=Marasmiellus scandens TaxID=2682957 RepID=A0ABR1K2J0_9AGAR